MQTGISLYFFIFLILSLSLLLIHRERSQHWPVIEWLQGQPDVSLAFSSFCAVYPPNSPRLFLNWLLPLFHLLLSLHFIFIHFEFSSLSTFLSLVSFYFARLSRAACLSLQDGAVHPWPGLWGHSEKADPKAEGAHTEVYRYGSEWTHLHHSKL